MKLEIDWLQANCLKVHNYGLGFIQLVIDPQTRLHFYSPTLVPEAVVSDLEFHNHRYDFISHVLKGELNNLTASFIYGAEGTYHRERVSCDPNKPVIYDYKTSGWGAPSYLKESKIKTGESYCMNSDTFHKASTDQDTITYLLRGTYKKDFAEVLRHVDNKDPVCPFSNPLSEKECWEIIGEMIKK